MLCEVWTEAEETALTVLYEVQGQAAETGEIGICNTA
jgi:hypothetical protein